MITRNKYRAVWEDGRSLVFLSDNRVTAGEAARAIACGKIESIRKIGTVTYEPIWPSPLRSDES